MSNIKVEFTRDEVVALLRFIDENAVYCDMDDDEWDTITKAQTKLESEKVYVDTVAALGYDVDYECRQS